MTRKQRKWLAEYLKCWNATEAARRAGYKWPNKIGPANLAKLAPQIRERLDEAAMTADEALARLAERARFDVSPYISLTDGRLVLDLARLVDDGHGRHVKSIKATAHGDIVEFYDGQECLILMAKHHGLLSDKAELSGEVMVVFGFSEAGHRPPESEEQIKNETSEEGTGP